MENAWIAGTFIMQLNDKRRATPSTTSREAMREQALDELLAVAFSTGEPNKPVDLDSILAAFTPEELAALDFAGPLGPSRRPVLDENANDVDGQ
jgi:hypothetical protein